MRVITWIKVAVVLALAASPAGAFSLLGPFTTWQVAGLGYQLTGDIGGPMGLGEGFRWNVPVITYAFDKSFLDYFGPSGVHAIDEAIQYFNDLQPASKMSPDLSEYSTTTIRENYQAAALGILDLKSTAMQLILEELGFADPIRYTFTLRSRRVDTINNISFTNYVTIMRNFDPVTLQPTRYVNGTLYTYENQEFRGPPQDYADAVELVAAGDASGANIPVASLTAVGLSAVGFAPGFYRTGLTRDDVGGIRYLYHPNNVAIESLLPTVTAGFGSAGAAWLPLAALTNQLQTTNRLVVNAGNTNATNLIISVGPRGGRNKLRFQKVFFDSLIGQTFTPITNQYTDVTIGSNLTLVVQSVQRGIVQPDMVFVSEDLGVARNLIPFLTSRTSTAGWIDNDALNGADETALSHGPGVIPPPVRISFSNMLPYFITDNLDLDQFPGESTAFSSGVWGSFDGSTNAPIIYPAFSNISLTELRNQILRGAR